MFTEAKDISHRDVINNHWFQRSELLIDNLLSNTYGYSRILVVRLDLYLPPHISNPNILSLLFTKLRNNSRHNSLFSTQIGYIKKLEYGQDRGWHLHVIFFFDGHQSCHDKILASEIGKYWNEVISEYTGTSYFSPNLKANNSYKYDGIGIIDYHDLQKIDDLKNYVVKYLCKVSPLPDGYKGVRQFSTSEFNPPTTNRGRPRMY